MSPLRTRKLLLQQTRRPLHLVNSPLATLVSDNHSYVRASSTTSFEWRSSASGPIIASLTTFETRTYRTSAKPPSPETSAEPDRRTPSPIIRGSTPKTPANPRTPQKSPGSAASEHVPKPDAVRTAEVREAALRAARLRRAGQREDAAVEAEKKELAKKEYQRRYKTNVRKWVSSIIAMPILLVTSYYLFDRLALKTPPKRMPRPKPTDD
ncbi:Fc.00g053920.m01.CDS01 [Cosmosporella sp. VM-42]